MPDDDPAPANAEAPRAYLDRMTLHHLRQLQDAVQCLMAAGDAVAKAGFEPVFDLGARAGMSMSIDYGLPMSRADAGPVYVGVDLAAGHDYGAQKVVLADIIEDRRREDRMKALDREFWGNRKLTKPAPGQQQAATPTAAAEVRDSDGGGGLAAPAPAVAPVDEMLDGEREGLQRHRLAEHDPVQAAADGEDKPDPAAAEAQPDAPAPGTARALAASARASAWTAEEDAQLIEAYAKALVAGTPKGQAISEIAASLGRPAQGTEFRVKTKLADQIRDAVALLRATAGTETQPPNSSGAAEQAAGAEPPPAPAAGPSRPALPADLTPIEAHLAGMPRAGNWTIERDHQLVKLACQGWDMPTIAAEMGCDSAALRARYDRLTALHPTDKTRRFGRETLLAAFARLMPAEG